MQLESKIVLGLYSDPSAFAVEIAVLRTDGLDIEDVIKTTYAPYPHELRERLIQYQVNKQLDMTLFNELNREVTAFFIQSAKEVADEQHALGNEIQLLGLSGYSALHDPTQKLHMNFGDAKTIAKALRFPVVHHFVKEDMFAGGCGSPLLASFWATLCKDMKKPLAVVGLGAVTHLVYIGNEGQLAGFDVSAGMSLIDRWVQKETDEEMDYDGILAAKGTAEPRVLKTLLKAPFMVKEPPKSARKQDFSHLMEHIEGLSPADGAATLTTFAAEAIIAAQRFLPEKPVQWLFIGGGTHNPTLMLQLAQKLPNVVAAKEVLPYTESLNAMGFAFIAVRHLMGLPISFPTTTGVSEPLSVGRITYPE